MEPGRGLAGQVGPGRGLMEDSGSFLLVVVEPGRGLLAEPGRCPSSSAPARRAAPASYTVQYSTLLEVYSTVQHLAGSVQYSTVQHLAGNVQYRTGTYMQCTLHMLVLNCSMSISNPNGK